MVAVEDSHFLCLAGKGTRQHPRASGSSCDAALAIEAEAILGPSGLFLLDSAVVIGVLTKRRSANHVMGALVRCANALEFASNIIVFYAFTRSTHNPADKPSRRCDIKKKGKFAHHAVLRK